ncbi:unnamed protein product [Caenorhabditis angaria]|uniref:Uncharacterized protein n=1 Tax=Caenorhabditis angaria TaxID=860376 RepID=A0A9P1N073_9PELO|nr:unnamed protein product [Caenorhabditis angaria]
MFFFQLAGNLARFGHDSWLVKQTRKRWKTRLNTTSSANLAADDLISMPEQTLVECFGNFKLDFQNWRIDNCATSNNRLFGHEFLAQRSASAIDTKQISMRGPHTSTPGARPTTTMRSMNKVDTSPGGSKFTRPAFGMARTNSNLRAKAPIASQPGSRNASPPRRTSTTASEIQRVKSNLGNSSFVASLTQEQAANLQNAMNSVRDQLRQPSKNDDDDFLLPKRPIKTTPQKSALILININNSKRSSKK